jgi:hypothetical protein
VPSPISFQFASPRASRFSLSRSRTWVFVMGRVYCRLTPGSERRGKGRGRWPARKNTSDVGNRGYCVPCDDVAAARGRAVGLACVVRPHHTAFERRPRWNLSEIPCVDAWRSWHDVGGQDLVPAPESGGTSQIVHENAGISRRLLQQLVTTSPHGNGQRLSHLSKVGWPLAEPLAATQQRLPV